MKKLKKILLINWLYFSKELIDVIFMIENNFFSFSSTIIEDAKTNILIIMSKFVIGNESTSLIPFSLS